MGMLETAPDALLADFQHFYGLDLDGLGTSISILRASDLAANLPQGAVIWQRIDPSARWTDTEYLLALIADYTGFTAWTKTSQAKKGAKWSSKIKRPSEQENTQNEKTGTMGTAQLLEVFYSKGN